MKNFEDLINEFESMGQSKVIAVEHDYTIKRVNTSTEQIMEECDLTIRRIDHVCESAKEALEISFDKKEIEPDVYIAMSEVRLQQYLDLISKVKKRRDALLIDRWV